MATPIVLATLAFFIVSTQSAKIDPHLLTSMSKDPQETFNIFISFKNAESNSQILSTSYQTQTDMINALKSNAEVTQKATKEFLASIPMSFGKQGFSTESFWINNQMYIRGATQSLLLTLAQRSDVAEIMEEILVHTDYIIERGVNANEEWGIRKIRAPEAWEEKNNRGEGIVVGILDTGVRSSHEALRDNYIGGDYGWFDAVNGIPRPYDDNGHGTHVAGSAVGKNGIGVAPGAKFMACKALDASGSGLLSDIFKCAQFFACPTRPDGSTPDCSKAPQIVSNSWGTNEGGLSFFDESIQAWHQMNIIPVFAIGNAGTACGTAGSPGDRDVISVGATDMEDSLAYFSSVGPSVDGRQKPEVSAPGVMIRSAYYQSNNDYAVLSGTSMACPHTSGLVAIMKSLKRDLTYEEAKDILQKTSFRGTRANGRCCSGICDGEFPNYQFGHGRIDALNAVRAL